MKLVAVRIAPVRIPLRAPLTTARGAVTVREGALVALEAEAGLVGWGETLPLPGFGLESAGEARRTLRRVAAQLLGQRYEVPGSLLDEIEPLTAAAPGARAALDLALHDLAARRDGAPLAEWLAKREGRVPRRRVRLAALVAGDEPEAAAQAGARAAALGFRSVKLKLGARGFDRDLARVRALRRALPEGVRLRLDANGAWSEDEARERLQILAAFDVEFLEEPVRAAEPAVLARLRADAAVPIAADEALRNEGSAADLLDANACDVLVVKPAAVGGLRTARRIAARARARGVPVVVTSFLDTSLGRSGALHLAASLPGESLDAGLATGGFLAREPFANPLPGDPEVEVPAAPGLGFVADPSRLRGCSSGEPWEIRW